MPSTFGVQQNCVEMEQSLSFAFIKYFDRSNTHSRVPRLECVLEEKRENKLGLILSTVCTHVCCSDQEYKCCYQCYVLMFSGAEVTPEVLQNHVRRHLPFQFSKKYSRDSFSISISKKTLPWTIQRFTTALPV